MDGPNGARTVVHGELQLSFMNFSIFEKDPSMAHELFPKII